MSTNRIINELRYRLARPHRATIYVNGANLRELLSYVPGEFPELEKRLEKHLELVGVEEPRLTALLDRLESKV